MSGEITVWTDATTDFTGSSDAAEIDAIGEAQFQAEQIVCNVMLSMQIERALLRRRLELSRYEQKSWEFRCYTERGLRGEMA